MTCLGHIDCVFVEDHGVVVGEGDAAAAQLTGRVGDGLRGRLIRQGVELAGFGDVPVLTEATSEVAASRPKRQHRGPRIEVVQRLLLDGVDAEAAGAAVGRENHFAVQAAADEAQPTLALAKPAEARAQIALHAAVVELMPVASRDDAGIASDGHVHEGGSSFLQPLAPSSNSALSSCQ